MKVGDKVSLHRLLNRRCSGEVIALNVDTGMVSVKLDEPQPELRDETVQVSSCYVTDAEDFSPLPR